LNASSIPSVTNPTGVVYLVGAGPGDPGLITLRGAALLASADVVVYDALANPQLLTHAPTAENIYVGKRAASHSMTQEQINRLLVDLATAGKRVVRLKGGDPFIFGRGGEECEALAAAGVRFEVVPGITAAIAAPAYAGIPVTHRDFNSSFTFLTGHEKEEAYQDPEAKTRTAGGGSDVEWSVIAKLPCIAFYMGVKSLPRITQRLIENGMDPATPAATIQSGTWPTQRTVVATLATIAEAVAAEKIHPPAMTIVGRVVSMRPTMNWFESRPLFGKTIVVTRARDQASELSEKFRSLGATVIEAPAIELVPGTDPAAVEAALLHGKYDWVLFTSVNGVKQTRQRLIELNLDCRTFGDAKIAAVGDNTAAAVRDHLGLKVDLCPKQFVAEALADALIESGEAGPGRAFLILRADIARPVLRTKLDQTGATVVDVAIYETRPITTAPPELIDALNERRIGWITFTSSSTVRNFMALIGNDAGRLAGVKLASIGPVTTEAMKVLGLNPTVEAQSSNLDGLVDAVFPSPGVPGEGTR
jgi:uroporphyrinogen III methyltransferase/synthase